MELNEINEKIAQARTRLMTTQKGSKCYRDTSKWLNNLYDKRAKMLYSNRKGKNEKI